MDELYKACLVGEGILIAVLARIIWTQVIPDIKEMFNFLINN